jgi:uncharacterized membrane protein
MVETSVYLNPMETEVSTIAILPVPFSPEQIIIVLAVLIPALVIFNLLLITEGIFESIGLRFSQALLATAGALLGSLIDIPLLPAGGALIAVNVGGAVIPFIVTAGMIARGQVSRSKTFIAVIAVALVTYAFATPVPGLGITMPLYIAPLAGAAAGLLLARGCHAAPGLAYAGGTMGTLLGADILNLANPDVLAALAGGRATVLSIGGAGIFDGIFITGVLSVLLAAYAGRHLREKGGICPQEEE